MDLTARRLNEIIAQHGPDAVAFYGSGQLDTEAVYLVGKLFKGCLGTQQHRLEQPAVHGRRRSPATAPAWAATARRPATTTSTRPTAPRHRQQHGRGAPGHCSTASEGRKRAGPSQQLIVVDPRRTATADAADLHVPVAPGGDIALLNALGRLLLDRRTQSTSRSSRRTPAASRSTQRFLRAQDDRRAVGSLPASTPRSSIGVADAIGRAQGFAQLLLHGAEPEHRRHVEEQQPHQPAPAHRPDRQAGRRAVLAHRPAQRDGRPRGRPARRTSCPATALVEDAEHRREVEALLGAAAPGSISPRPGLTAVEMFRALENGQAQGDLDRRHQPAVSLPDLHQVRRALARAELVVVQDAYHPTETTRCADVLLPAGQWGEKEWTSTNSERMVAFSPKLFDPPGVGPARLADPRPLRPDAGFRGLRFRASRARSGTSSRADDAAGRATWPA